MHLGWFRFVRLAGELGGIAALLEAATADLATVLEELAPDLLVVRGLEAIDTPSLLDQRQGGLGVAAAPNGAGGPGPGGVGLATITGGLAVHGTAVATLLLLVLLLATGAGGGLVVRGVGVLLAHDCPP